ncbi:MAG: hypothetical protein EWM72_01424 [Nitrospira sp.]|nr:MAG: hypothetical protein EWM72_01424 [Nitrospira sp.]
MIEKRAAGLPLGEPGRWDSDQQQTPPVGGGG